MLGVKRLNRAEATIRIFDKRVELDRGDELKIRFGGESMMSVRNIVVMGEFLGETFLEHLLPWIEKCVEQGKIGQGLSVFNPRRMRVVME